MAAKLKTVLYYKLVFGSIGQGSRIYKPMLLVNPYLVHIGKSSMIRKGARIEALVVDPQNPPTLQIGNNVNIEQNVHIICSSRVVIGDNVSITGHCAIVDTNHPFQDIHDPRKIGSRIDPRPTPVEIGDSTFIGFGTVVLPNVKIGRYCVIGANSTVTRDIPDFSVASGSPAKVTLQYCSSERVWLKPGC